MDKNVNSKKISICIPTWEQHGKGASFLEQLFVSIESQTYKNYNVVVSDQSLNDEIKNLCETFSNKFDIIYVKNKKDLGNGPANTNNCIKNADGEIIKIMFQDDFFYDQKALEIINHNFVINDCIWLVNGCNHTKDSGKTYFQQMIPKWNENILIGVNTISSPSVLSFKKEVDLFFDENLVMLMDCEYYYSLYKKFGLPLFLEDCLITGRFHEHQISTLYDHNNLPKEINYVKNKHKV
jgi:glycosyltransferase involved in cell wall biosynthesis